jgi:hypothetical protein
VILRSLGYGRRPNLRSATHQQGNEAAIFKAVFWQSVVLASLVGVIVMFYAYVMPSIIP